MIRLWLSREQGTPIWEQLSTQLQLGIVSRRIAAGERLPSVRELARRLKIHPNTVSAAYQDLARRGWAKNVKGSGVFARDAGQEPKQRGIDGFVHDWLQAANERGYSASELEAALQRVSQEKPNADYLVVDPDADLARILAKEIADGTGWEVRSASLEEAIAGATSQDTTVLTLRAQAARAASELPAKRFVTIMLRSLDELLIGHQRPGSTDLIGMVSRSDSIRQWSATLLSALGLAPDSILLRSPKQAQWKRGLAACTVVSADVEAYAELPANVQRRSLIRLVSAAFLAEMAHE